MVLKVSARAKLIRILSINNYLIKLNQKESDITLGFNEKAINPAYPSKNNQEYNVEE